MEDRFAKDRPYSCEKCQYGVCEHEEFWGAIVQRWSCGTESGACAYYDKEMYEDEEYDDE